MNENSSLSSNFWANLRQILVLPKWAKIFLVALSSVAVAGLIAAFGLKAWAADKVDSGEIVLKGIDKSAQERILKAESAENKFAFDSRLYFQRLDFLLRSKVIAYIDIQGISWAEGIDKNAVTNISSHNRWVKFVTTQDLLSQGFADKNLGKVEYKMDFSPFFKTIIKYYLIIALSFYALLVLFQATFGTMIFKKISSILSQESLLPAIYQYYKRINPLYRHSFWILFIACNVVYFFHTAQFLWGREDWGVIYNELMSSTWTRMEGRYMGNMQVWLHNHWLLPVLNNLLCFVSVSIAGILVSIYLGLQKKLWIFVLVGLCFCIEPFILGRLYFSHQSLGIFMAATIGVLGFVLAKKAGEFSPAYNGGGGGATLSTRRLIAQI